ncbi:MAG: 30S ribosomal protein S8 [Synergistetes bacterium]|nr:30S ribosomal protein S8 [Synergistota bacterium]
MVVTDPIADMLTRMRNVLINNGETVDVPLSQMKVAIARVLRKEGYIRNFKIIKNEKPPKIRIYLKYGPNNEKIINSLKRVSKPSARVYVKRKDMPIIKNGLGIAILSTSKGIMSSKEAYRRGVGGEVLCYIW